MFNQFNGSGEIDPGGHLYINSGGVYDTGKIPPRPQSRVYIGTTISGAASAPIKPPLSHEEHARIAQQFATNRAEASQAAQAELDARVHALTINRESLFATMRNEQIAYQAQLREAQAIAEANLRVREAELQARREAQLDKGEGCCGKTCFRTRGCVAGPFFLIVVIFLALCVAVPIAALVLPQPDSVEYDSGCGAMWSYCLFAFSLACVVMFGALLIHFSHYQRLKKTTAGSVLLWTGIVLVFGIMVGMSFWGLTMLVRFRQFQFEVCKNDTTNHNRLYVVTKTVAFQTTLYPVVSLVLWAIILLYSWNSADKDDETEALAEPEPGVTSSAYAPVASNV